MSFRNQPAATKAWAETSLGPARTTACATVMLVLSLAGIHPGLAQTDWPIYGHDPSGLQFSPLKQIDTTNVSTVDVERGLLFLPVGTPPDFYGGTRKGSNLYGSSLVALDAFSTG